MVAVRERDVTTDIEHGDRDPQVGQAATDDDVVAVSHVGIHRVASVGRLGSGRHFVRVDENLD